MRSLRLVHQAVADALAAAQPAGRRLLATACDVGGGSASQAIPSTGAIIGGEPLDTYAPAPAACTLLHCCVVVDAPPEACCWLVMMIMKLQVATTAVLAGAGTPLPPIPHPHACLPPPTPPTHNSGGGRPGPADPGAG